MTVIVPSASTVRPQAYTAPQLNSSRSLTGPSNTVPVKAQPAVVVSIGNGSNATAIAAGASNGGIAAAALSDTQTYNKIAARAAGQNFDVLVKIEGYEKAQATRAADEASIKHFADIVATEAAAAGVPFSVASSQNEISGSQPHAIQNDTAEANYLSGDQTSYQETLKVAASANPGITTEGGAGAALQILQSATDWVSKTV